MLHSSKYGRGNSNKNDSHSGTKQHRKRSNQENEGIGQADIGEPIVRDQDRDIPTYSYEALAKKPDIKIHQLKKVSANEATAYKENTDLFAKQMRKIASEKGNKKNTSTSTFAHCKDLNEDVLITRDSFKHGSARMDTNYIAVCKSITDILENSVVVNELAERKDTDGGYVLLGIAENADNYVIVRSIVNKKTWKLEDYNQLYAIKKKSIKKENVGFKPPHYTQESGYGTFSTISIADFLRFVNTDINEHNSDFRYLDRFWHTGMTESEVRYIEYLAQNEIGNSQNDIYNTAKWLYNNKKGKSYFAIYSTVDEDNPTILYASKGKKANEDNNWTKTLFFLLNEKGGGDRGNNERSTNVLGKMFGPYGNGIRDNDADHRETLGTGSNEGNDRIYRQNSNFRPSRALLNCIENLEEISIQGNRGRVKDQDRDLPTTRFLLANALDSIPETEVDKETLAKYRKMIDHVDKLSDELEEAKREYHDMMFTKGKRDSKRKEQLEKVIKSKTKTIGYWDKSRLASPSSFPPFDCDGGGKQHGTQRFNKHILEGVIKPDIDVAFDS